MIKIILLNVFSCKQSITLILQTETTFKQVRVLTGKDRRKDTMNQAPGNASVIPAKEEGGEREEETDNVSFILTVNGLGVVAHTFNPRTWEVEIKDLHVVNRLAWDTQ